MTNYQPIYEKTLQHAADLTPAERGMVIQAVGQLMTEQNASASEALGRLDRVNVYHYLRHTISDPIAWQAEPGMGIRRFVTDKQLQGFPRGVHRFYQPYRCVACTSAAKAAA